jgi:hypothetical protein
MNMKREHIMIACIVALFGLIAFGYFAIKAQHAATAYTSGLNKMLDDNGK